MKSTLKTGRSTLSAEKIETEESFFSIQVLPKLTKQKEFCTNLVDVKI